MRRLITILTAILAIAAVPALTGREAVATANPPAIEGGAASSLADCREPHLELCELITLAEGAEGRAVRQLQSLLYLKKFYRGAIDGVFDREVAVSVATFHKAIGPARSDATDRRGAVANWRANPPSEVFAAGDWRRLSDFRLIPPKARIDQPDRVEVDIGHQLLYLMLGGKVNAIVHVSTGFDPYDTPRTKNFPNGSHFYMKHSYNGWSPLPGAWSIYKFWAYLGRDNNYGVHGYRTVPYYPASHGCIRVNVWDADYLHERFFIGMPIYVWDE
ncbi:MAG: L,D-transpeptidase [Actinobacteria bacterium]|nr:L,D-transpeptidase [Actinomycetota bacterium]